MYNKVYNIASFIFENMSWSKVSYSCCVCFSSLLLSLLFYLFPYFYWNRIFVRLGKVWNIYYAKNGDSNQWVSLNDIFVWLCQSFTSFWTLIFVLNSIPKMQNMSILFLAMLNRKKNLYTVKKILTGSGACHRRHTLRWENLCCKWQASDSLIWQ